MTDKPANDWPELSCTIGPGNTSVTFDIPAGVEFDLVRVNMGSGEPVKNGTVSVMKMDWDKFYSEMEGDWDKFLAAADAPAKEKKP
jgi:hypothetical protein